MAWPCITRACCINRFWSDLDKGDIAVPLVFTKYSDVADVQHLHPQPRPLISQNQSSHPDAAKVVHDAAGPSSHDGSGASVMREDFKAWTVRPERSCKPRDEYQPSKAPFNNVTQYQKDYKPWPIPKRGDHPWIPKAASCKISKQEQATSELETGVEKCEIEEKLQEKESKEKRKKSDRKENGKDDAADRKRRSTADALNRQIKQEGSSYR